MTKMQLLQPEINKIKAKYGDSKDPEIVKKIQMEQQALYQKNKVNPLMGCLPMLITLPIFFALNSLFRETYRYIGRIGDLYTQISNAIISVPGFNAIPAFRELVRAKLPKGVAFDFFKAADVSKAVNVFTPADWAGVQAAFPAEGWAGIAALLEKKDATETFLTLNMVSPAGLKWPGIVIPILVAATTLLSSFIMMKTSNNQDSQQKTQTYMMMIVMPVMMFMFTINMSSGVGIYWIVSSVYQTVQQYLLNKYYSKRITLDTAPKKVKAK
jgi:YidC/Oxa1 family membrane protein insertase